MAEPKHGTGPIAVNETPGRKSYCMCGWSEKLPYCDGSHREKAPGLHSCKVEVTAPGMVYVCQCHQTKTPPWCDGTHKTLPPT